MTVSDQAVELRLPALAITQSPGRVLYQFAVDGKLLDDFATVSRIRRDDESAVQGYQRPESLQHITAIRKYIESNAPMIPNGIVIAFDDRVRFEPSVKSDTYSVPGEIVIPVDASEEPELRPGWIVDGQQRTAAIRDANVSQFPIPVTAFITANEEEQREQFILVNSTKPLPRSLIYELIPGTKAMLPPNLARRKLSAELLDLLNWDTESPFHWRIQTPTNPDGVIKDNSVLRMLDNSIIEGYLYKFRDPADGTGDLEAMASVVNEYWTAVSEVFPKAWCGTPRTSRLVHGAGIVAMGFLMDAVCDVLERSEELGVDGFRKEIASIRHDCAWTDGEWILGPGTRLRWNEFENTSRDIQMLAGHILSSYRAHQPRTPLEDFHNSPNGVG